MDGAILVTGATGMIGRELTALLLKETGVELYLLLHESNAHCEKEALLNKVFGVPATSEFMSRLHLLQGDVTKENMGLPKEACMELWEVITGIVHAAASTRFDLPLSKARHINVGGTEQIIRFAEACPNLQRFGFLSTAHVAGKCTGTIYEDDLTHPCGFVNSYEQSKYEAEQLIRQARATLPIAVYRISTVVGDSRTGYVNHFTAPHQSLQIMYMGLAALVPGTPDYVVDLIPSDYTALTLFRLYTSHFKAGQVFHITAGARKSYTLEEIIDESFRYLAEFDPVWGMRRYPKPVIASLEAFELSIHTIRQANNPLMLGVMEALSHFAAQLTYPKRFDTTHLLECLPDYERDLPDIRSYYGEVVRYCLSTKWGRNV